MSQKALYAVIAALVVVVAVLGYGWYQQSQKADSVDISVGKDGLSITTN